MEKIERLRESYSNKKEIFPDICVCCGKPVPEGRMICWSCEHGSDIDEIDAFRGTRNSISQEQ